MKTNIVTEFLVFFATAFIGAIYIKYLLPGISDILKILILFVIIALFGSMIIWILGELDERIFGRRRYIHKLDLERPRYSFR
ncbi:MAG: hypothetical protein WC867_01985 [Candidatus Pacearchaeota archaeon]|jgi:hypothetical protein